jgi:RsiW-degrading membrane proteinase PrsW (M82 family)
MEFKKLDIKPEGSWIKRMYQSPHIRKSIVSIAIGALIGFGYYYFTEGNQLDAMPLKEVGKSMLMGAFFGFFITNSPCSKGKC